jgi:DNA-binding ferritin-like protein
MLILDIGAEMKVKIVTLPNEQYEQLDASRPNEQVAFTLDTAPQEDIESLMAGFQQIIDQVESARVIRDEPGDDRG